VKYETDFSRFWNKPPKLIFVYITKIQILMFWHYSCYQFEIVKKNPIPWRIQMSISAIAEVEEVVEREAIFEEETDSMTWYDLMREYDLEGYGAD